MKKLFSLFSILLLVESAMAQNVGIGTTTPDSLLTVSGSAHIVGTVKTSKIQITAGAGFNKILQSDIVGNATWVVQPPSNTHSIGDSYGGGIVFYVYDNGQHGLIAAAADQNTGIQWWGGSFTTTNAVRNGIAAGMFNTERIIASQGQATSAYAAQICANHLAGNFGDWYLPGKYELDLLYLQKAAVGGFENSLYWSSTEIDNVGAWSQNFSNGNQANNNKNALLNVRAVRAF